MAGGRSGNEPKDGLKKLRLQCVAAAGVRKREGFSAGARRRTEWLSIGSSDFLKSMRENIPGFENSRVLSTALQIGARESRMIAGEYRLTQEDLKACTKFPDGIAAGNYDIDIHNPEGSGTSHYFFAPGAYYTIPYRCLLPKGTTNLLVAGRCISSTHEAQASYRVMPIVCCIGEAAGVAAGVAHQARVSLRAVDIQRVRVLLQAGGAPI